jgi:NADPH-dependent ferric siderophore reductase
VTSQPVRREPPTFRQVEVRRTERVTPRLVRVTLTGAKLSGFAVDEPAASVRLLIPAPGEIVLTMPEWNGNEFLLPDGRRPTIRTLTPRRADPVAGDLDVDVVVHEGGTLSAWVEAAGAGDRAAVSGPGRGYEVDPDTAAYLLAGDETAIPAMSQLLEALPSGPSVQVLVEVADLVARHELPGRSADVEWHVQPDGAAPGDALATAVRDAPIDPGARVWVAGEAAAVQRIRRHLFDERGIARAQAVVRGYWKHGRAA